MHCTLFGIIFMFELTTLGLLKLQFPIGIDSDRFIQALELPQVKDHIKDLKERFAGRKVNTIYKGKIVTDQYLVVLYFS